MNVGEKGHTGWHPRKWKMPTREERKALRLTRFKAVRLEKREEREGRQEDRCFLLGFSRRNPERPQRPREHLVPSQPNTLRSEKGHGFLNGMKPLKRSFEADQVSE